MKNLILISSLLFLVSCGKSGGNGSADANESKSMAQPLFSVLMQSGFKTVYDDGQVIKKNTNEEHVELSARRPVYRLSSSEENLTTAAQLYAFVETNKATLPVCDFQPLIYGCSSLIQKDWRAFTLPNNVYDNYDYFN